MVIQSYSMTMLHKYPGGDSSDCKCAWDSNVIYASLGNRIMRVGGSCGDPEGASSHSTRHCALVGPFVCGLGASL